MRVLVACEFSGIVRDAFRERGHDAWSCDLLPTERNGPHVEGDVLDLLGDNWDLMIAHPPCTYLTNAGVRHLHDYVVTRTGKHASCYGKERWERMEKASEFFNTLWKCEIPKICVENPIPHKYSRKLIGDYTQLIQPWQFGHGETKATCLWLKNLPMLQPTHRDNDLFLSPEPSEIVATCHLLPPSIDRWKKRSRTYPGIAKAMAEQWG